MTDASNSFQTEEKVANRCRYCGRCPNCGQLPAPTWNPDYITQPFVPVQQPPQPQIFPPNIQW